MIINGHLVNNYKNDQSWQLCAGMGEVWAVFCHLCCLRFLQQQWNGGSLGSFCHLCCLWFLQQQQKMPSGALCLCLRALQEYGDDGIRHDDVKDFFNDAYAHKTLLITLCRWMIHIQANWFLDGTVQLYTCMNSSGLVSLVYREVEQCCCCIFTPAFTIAPLLLSFMDRFRSVLLPHALEFFRSCVDRRPSNKGMAPASTIQMIAILMLVSI